MAERAGRDTRVDLSNLLRREPRAALRCGVNELPNKQPDEKEEEGEEEGEKSPTTPLSTADLDLVVVEGIVSQAPDVFSRKAAFSRQVRREEPLSPWLKTAQVKDADGRPWHLLLLELRRLLREHAAALDHRGRLLLSQELDRVICEQTEARDSKSGLKLRLLHALHRNIGPGMDLQGVRDCAVHDDDVPRFVYAHENCERYGVPTSHMVLAARYGAVSTLEYGLQHRGDFRWDAEALFYAAHGGDVRVVNLTLRGGCEPCGAALCIAAGRGHLACVRYLHTLGLPLWDCVEVADDSGVIAGEGWCFRLDDTRLLVPALRCDAASLWGVMGYGQVHGAPLPEVAGCIMKERRDRARAVLLSFHCAARHSRAGGEHARVWGLMADVPVDVVCIILVCAELKDDVTWM